VRFFRHILVDSDGDGNVDQGSVNACIYQTMYVVTVLEFSIQVKLMFECYL